MKSTVTLTPKDTVKRIAEVYGFPPEVGLILLTDMLEALRKEGKKFDGKFEEICGVQVECDLKPPGIFASLIQKQMTRRSHDNQGNDQLKTIA